MGQHGHNTQYSFVCNMLCYLQMLLIFTLCVYCFTLLNKSVFLCVFSLPNRVNQKLLFEKRSLLSNLADHIEITNVFKGFKWNDIIQMSVCVLTAHPPLRGQRRMSGCYRHYIYCKQKLHFTPRDETSIITGSFYTHFKQFV